MTKEGSIAGIQMQPYESHIPFLLQFTSSYNIAPMGWIHLQEVKVRFFFSFL
jgi:DNA polymerase zeta